MERTEESATRGVIFREVNEHIAELSGDWSETEVRLLVCECSNPWCAKTLEVERAQYERVRADGARFLVLAGHELLDVERVVERTDRFLVVEKIGSAARIARHSNPREEVGDERNAA